MRLVGVPMIDRNPVDGCAEILARAGHQIAGERAQVGHLGRVLGRYDKAEMVPVIRAALGEGRHVGGVAARIEQAGVRAVPGYAVALQIAEMLDERCRAETRPALSHDAGLDDDAPLGRAERERRGRSPSAAEAAASSRRTTTEPWAGMPGLSGGTHDLADEALRLTRSATAVTEPAGSDAHLVVLAAHWEPPDVSRPKLAPKLLLKLRNIFVVPAGRAAKLAGHGFLSL